MKISKKCLAKTILILVFLAVLPVVGQRLIPQEFYRAFSAEGGFDVADILNRIAVVGVVLAVLVFLRGHVEKASPKWLVLSSGWKVFWLAIVFFLLGVGHPETLGLAVLGGKADGHENTVVFDFRLFAFLVTVIVVLMIVRSVIQFREDNPKISSQDAMSSPEVHVGNV